MFSTVDDLSCLAAALDNLNSVVKSCVDFEVGGSAAADDCSSWVEGANHCISGLLC